MKKVLLAAGSLAVAVCRYAAGERHGPHTDPHSRISFVLRGGYREEGKPGAVQMRPGDLLLKSHRARHEDEFGQDGATLIAVEFLDDDPFDAAADPDLWRQRADGFSLRHTASFLEAALAGDARAVRAAACDIVADTTGATHERTAPDWLERLRCELEEASLANIDVAARAREAGAHPAHASRLFRRCYGASITEHAQAHSVRRTIAPLSDPATPLSEVALAAGFYDQSHMNRVFRRVTGRTPGAYRGALAAC